jgi:hypothetical protein
VSQVSYALNVNPAGFEPRIPHISNYSLQITSN